jgi:hypothetical protein
MIQSRRPNFSLSWLTYVMGLIPMNDFLDSRDWRKRTTFFLYYVYCINLYIIYIYIYVYFYILFIYLFICLFIYYYLFIITCGLSMSCFIVFSQSIHLFGTIKSDLHRAQPVRCQGHWAIYSEAMLTSYRNQTRNRRARRLS